MNDLLYELLAGIYSWTIVMKKKYMLFAVLSLSQKKKNIYFFFRGHGNESCNLIGSLPGQYFPISDHGPR